MSFIIVKMIPNRDDMKNSFAFGRKRKKHIFLVKKNKVLKRQRQSHLVGENQIHSVGLNTSN